MCSGVMRERVGVGGGGYFFLKMKEEGGGSTQMAYALCFFPQVKRRSMAVTFIARLMRVPDGNVKA